MIVFCEKNIIRALSPILLMLSIGLKIQVQGCDSTLVPLLENYTGATLGKGFS